MRLVLFFLAFLLNFKAHAQKERNLGLSLDYQFEKYKSLSLGFGHIEAVEHCALIGKGYLIRNEFIFKNEKNNFVYSPQVNAFVNFAILYVGARASYYTDFSHSTFGFTPEIGLGLSAIIITYGRNFNLAPNEFIPLNTHDISVKILIPFMAFNL